MPQRRSFARRFLSPRCWLAATLLAALTACGPQVPVASLPVTPPTRPVQPASPPPASAQSEALRLYYRSVQQDLLAQGMLRTDGGGADTPFTDVMLAVNFTRIALFDEYQRGATGLVQRETESRLRRWVAPVRAQLIFGASVPDATRAADRARIGSFLARLSRITGHPVGLSDAAPNFLIYIVNEDERRTLGPTFRAQVPGLEPGDIAGLVNLPRSTYCTVYALSEGNSGVYTRALAVIRAEHPDLLRLSCVHEELAQSLGLANDSPRARPSIFNDDEEFALLTRQDEIMLRMLYDPRLRPGMTLAEAEPIIQTIATEILGGAS